MGLIYNGQDIRTTAAYCLAGDYRGRVLYPLTDGAIAAGLWEPGYEEDIFSVNLDADEWELAESPPDLHEGMYTRGLFDEQG